MRQSIAFGVSLQRRNMMKIRFIFPRHDFEINLVSKYTCFVGQDSGEGKTELLSLIEDSVQDNSLQIQSSVPVSVATPATLEALLELPTRHVFIIDEFSVLRDAVLKKVQASNHLFICITRALPLHLSYSYYGIYHVTRTDTFFRVSLADDLNVVSQVPQDTECIVTEATAGKSEHELLSNYGIVNLKAAGGRDRIHNVLDKNKKQLILADLGNIGKAYSLLRKDCKRKNIYFYDYSCFEELLNEAPILQRFTKPKLDPYSFDSLERYNSYVLTERTKGTEFHYLHGKKLPKAYLGCKKEDILNSPVGNGLLCYLRDMNSASFLSTSDMSGLNVFDEDNK